MKYLSLPDETRRILPFYLAMEEYAATMQDEDEWFFLWRVEPTVIVGRNQLISAEVNVPFCRTHGISLYRRRSGGGCVYADRGNIMMSYIARGEEVEPIFRRYTEQVAAMLRGLGLDAKASERNDVLVGGRKVSGNALYRTAGHCIVHGTMLFDTEMEHMLGALTPGEEKLAGNGIASVRSRITTLREHLSMDIETFVRHIRETLCEGEKRLGAEDVKAIERLTEPYLEENFLWGSNPRYEVVRSARFEGVGRIEMWLEMRHDVVSDLELSGDFFSVGNAREEILRRLQGKRLTTEAVTAAFAGCDAGEWILNLKNEQLINLLTN